MPSKLTCAHLYTCCMLASLSLQKLTKARVRRGIFAFQSIWGRVNFLISSLLGVRSHITGRIRQQFLSECWLVHDLVGPSAELQLHFVYIVANARSCSRCYLEPLDCSYPCVHFYADLVDLLSKIHF